MAARPVTKAILVVFGSLFVGLGVAGIFLPLLPTTPFLLLAAACFTRSSERLHTWLITHKRLGPYVSGYVTGSGIPVRAKVVTLVLLWGTISYCAVYLVPMVWAKVLLLVVAVSVSVFVLTRKTLRGP
jgi:uncharacterized membrane protein YbaN (DUF454 family)